MVANIILIICIYNLYLFFYFGLRLMLRLKCYRLLIYEYIAVKIAVKKL